MTTETITVANRRLTAEDHERYAKAAVDRMQEALAELTYTTAGDDGWKNEKTLNFAIKCLESAYARMGEAALVRLAEESVR